jgi:tetratricopeptide (TPR) repeat protein
MWERSRRDREQAGVAARLAAEADRQARLARLDYERKIVDEREGRARKALEKARAALRRAEAPAPPGERTFDDPLVEATMHYNVYLDVHPDDAAGLVERSRVHALRRTYQRAVDDLERAIALDRSLEPKVRENLEMLRRMLPKK